MPNPTCTKCNVELGRRSATIDGEYYCLPCVCDWAAEKSEAKAAGAIGQALNGSRSSDHLEPVMGYIEGEYVCDVAVLERAREILSSIGGE